MPGDAARAELLGWLDQLIAGKVPAEIQLDLIEAAARAHRARAPPQARAVRTSKPKDDPLAPYREVLAGGDAQRGMTIFTDQGRGRMPALPQGHGPRPARSAGGEVGPELSGIGARQNRAYILESIVDPNKQIAQGFESVVLATSDGKVITGVLRGEDDKEVRLMTAEGKLVAVPKDTIEDRKRGPSAMPADLVAEALQDRAPRPDRVPRQLEDPAQDPMRSFLLIGRFGRGRGGLFLRRLGLGLLGCKNLVLLILGHDV